MDEHRNSNYLMRRDFDADVREDGTIVYVPKKPALKVYGEPPWELVLDDGPDLIPVECTDLVESLVWRGATFRRVK